MTGTITHKEALDSMLDFVRTNIGGLDRLQEEGNCFSGIKDDVGFVLVLNDSRVRPASSFIDDVKGRSKEGIVTAHLMLRSTTHYHGDLLKQLVYIVDGKNTYWQRNKNISTFEQKAIDLFGNPVDYYNPQTGCVEVVCTERFYHMSEYLKSKTAEELVSDSRLRQVIHIEENRERAYREIHFDKHYGVHGKITGPFTLRPYERKNRKLARIVTDTEQ